MHELKAMGTELSTVYTAAIYPSAVQLVLCEVLKQKVNQQEVQSSFGPIGSTAFRADESRAGLEDVHDVSELHTFEGCDISTMLI